MKKFFKIGCLGIILLIVAGVIIAMIGGDGDSGNDASSSGNADTAEEKEATYGIGDVVKVGDFEYTIHGFEQASVVGPEYLTTEAKGVFVVVDLTVKNVGNESVMMDSSYFQLKNGEKTFDADSTATMSVNEDSTSFFLEQINPDLEMSGKVVFDVSQEVADSGDLILVANADIFGMDSIEIHLSE